MPLEQKRKISLMFGIQYFDLILHFSLNGNETLYGHWNYLLSGFGLFTFVTFPMLIKCLVYLLQIHRIVLLLFLLLFLGGCCIHNCVTQIVSVYVSFTGGFMRYTLSSPLSFSVLITYN